MTKRDWVFGAVAVAQTVVIVILCFNVFGKPAEDGKDVANKVSQKQKTEQKQTSRAELLSEVKDDMLVNELKKLAFEEDNQTKIQAIDLLLELKDRFPESKKDASDPNVYLASYPEKPKSDVPGDTFKVEPDASIPGASNLPESAFQEEKNQEPEKQEAEQKAGSIPTSTPTPAKPLAPVFSQKPVPPGREVEEAFVRLLLTRTEDVENRKEAALQLGDFRYYRVARVLERVMLNDHIKEVRKEAAKSLGKVGNEDFLPALKKAAAQDVDDEVRMEAHQSIQKIEQRNKTFLQSAGMSFQNLR